MKPFLLNLRKTGLLAVAATLLLTACKKDKDDTDNPPPPGSAKIKKVAKGNDVLEFAYNTDGTVKSVNMSDDLVTGGTPAAFNVTYNAGKVAELKAAGGPRFVAHYTGNELTTADMFDENGDLVLKSRYEYLNGALKSITASVGTTDVLKFSFTYDAAGNVKRNNTWMLDAQTGDLEPVSGYEYAYDDKTNPMAAHKALLYLLFQNTPKNNVTKETEFDAQNAVAETTEYTYQYNNQNLPQSATVKTTVPGQQPTTSALNYTYQ